MEGPGAVLGTIRNGVFQSMNAVLGSSRFDEKVEVSHESIMDGLCSTVYSFIALMDNLSCSHSSASSCPACIEDIAKKCTHEFFLRMMKDFLYVHGQSHAPSLTSSIFPGSEPDIDDNPFGHFDFKPPTNITVRGENISPNSRPPHCMVFTKEVPPLYALCMRGRACKLCGDLFKGKTCSADLIQHVKKCHRKNATPQYIRKLAELTTAKEIIGEGMWYCPCRLCTGRC